MVAEIQAVKNSAKGRSFRSQVQDYALYLHNLEHPVHEGTLVTMPKFFEMVKHVPGMDSVDDVSDHAQALRPSFAFPLLLLAAAVPAR